MVQKGCIFWTPLPIGNHCPAGTFSKSGRATRSRFQAVLGYTFCYAAWENGSHRVPRARVPEFGSAVGMGILQRGFCGEISRSEPLAWSDRGQPNRTHTVCNVSNPGWTARWGYDGATRSPRRPAGLSTTPTPWFVSLPAITHCLPVTCATTWDRPGTHKGWRWEPDPGIPVKKNYRTTVPIPLASSHSLRAPHAVRGWI